jgi:hypothetical protein
MIYELEFFFNIKRETSSVGLLKRALIQCSGLVVSYSRGPGFEYQPEILYRDVFCQFLHTGDGISTLK